MKTWQKIFTPLFIVSALLLGLGLSTGHVFVHAQDNAEEQLRDLTEEIERYEQEISKLKSQATTLSNQIAQFDAQIRLTSLKIAETEEKIKLLGGRIDQLETSLDSLTEAFTSRAVKTYKMTKLNEPFLMVVTAPDLSGAVSSFHYLQRIQEADRSLLVRLEKAQTAYKGEKVEQEELHDELEEQRAVLGAQKSAKASLLEQTRSNERRYQELLSQALAEKAALENALTSGVEVGPVSVGDPIGLVGNSGYPGCSTGKHLHFEVRKDESWVNPAPYLQSKTVQDEQSGGGSLALGSGNWPWPIQDTVRLTQHYGETPYSWRYTYSGGIHTGLDMVSTTSDVIRAPADGTLFKSSQNCGSGSVINIVYIDHGDGLLSFYLHVQ